jgi:hypothetical protein
MGGKHSGRKSGYTYFAVSKHINDIMYMLRPSDQRMIKLIIKHKNRFSANKIECFDMEVSKLQAYSEQVFGLSLESQIQNEYKLWRFKILENWEYTLDESGYILDWKGMHHPCGIPIKQLRICRTQCYLADKCKAAQRIGVKSEKMLPDSRVHSSKDPLKIEGLRWR